MINKIIRLSKALRNESAKRVPIILVLLVILLLWSNYSNGQKANQTLDKLDKQGTKLDRQNEQIKAQGAQIKQLSQENNALSQQNKDLAQQARDQGTCFVKAFAIYTQTLQPVTFDQIEQCNIVVAKSSTTTPATVTPLPKPLQVAPPAPQPTLQVTPPPNPPVKKAPIKKTQNILQNILHKIGSLL